MVACFHCANPTQPRTCSTFWCNLSQQQHFALMSAVLKLPQVFLCPVCDSATYCSAKCMQEDEVHGVMCDKLSRARQVIPMLYATLVAAFTGVDH